MSLEVLEYSCLKICPTSLVGSVRVASAVAIRLLINSLTLDLGSSRGS